MSQTRVILVRGLTNAFLFKVPKSDKNKNTRFLHAICQILKSNFPRFKRSSAMLKIILII